MAAIPELCCVSCITDGADARSTWLFVMDAYETLNLETETSLLLMEALIARGQRVLWTEMHGVYLDQANLRAGVREVRSARPLTLLPPEDISLSTIDAILVRKDPPFDSSYLHLTYLLGHLDAGIAQFNNVAALRNLNEKLLPLRWPHLTPPTITTMSMAAALGFLGEHKEIVVKPLDDCSGRGILRISSEDEDPRAVLAEAFADQSGAPRYLIAQAFLPAVREGDKRVFLLDGRAIGAVNRVPAKDSFLANIHQGALCEAAELTDVENSAIAEVGPFLKSEGVLLAGVDFIGGLITEINLTSPSALRQINAVSGIELEQKVVDEMIAHVRSLKDEFSQPECCLAAA